MMDYKGLDKMWKRREWARKSGINCPECETEQVQLTDWRTNNLKFRCRKCHLRFEMVCE